ncbi:MAG: 5-oxoprolinase subunit PxpB [Thalassotalea sp.]
MTRLTKLNTVDKNADKVNIELVAENALLLTWPEVICHQQHQVIVAVQNQIKAKYQDAIIDSIVSYNSLMLYFRFDKVTTENLTTCLKNIINSPLTNKAAETSRQIEIPVYYGSDAGLDLANVSQHCKLSINEIIQLHSQATYRAYALGFTPGFCYLAGVNQKLWLPRLSTPRTSVPAGSVAIAEQQTAVYPSASPGGWHIIGNTPTPMFSFENKEFKPLIRVGDEIRFVPINKDVFLSMGASPS